MAFTNDFHNSKAVSSLPLALFDPARLVTCMLCASKSLKSNLTSLTDISAKLKSFCAGPGCEKCVETACPTDIMTLSTTLSTTISTIG